MSASMAFRKNEYEIRNGRAPEKYLRILPFIEGENIIEIGSAEGVLALLIAREGKKVTAVEKSLKRYGPALELKSSWKALGYSVDGCEIINADIRQRLDLLEGKDTLVAVRCLYHIHTGLYPVFLEAAKHVRNVVLCGNENRQRQFFETRGKEPGDAGRCNFYAGYLGMQELLAQSGFSVVHTVKDGDPIVVGKRV